MNKDITISRMGGVWSLDEKMGQTYTHYEQANTLAQRDYKQPQAVIYNITIRSERSDEYGNDSQKADAAGMRKASGIS